MKLSITEWDCMWESCIEDCLFKLSPKTHRMPLYLSTFEAAKKWTMPIRNWGQVYGELSIMYEGRLPE